MRTLSGRHILLTEGSRDCAHMSAGAFARAGGSRRRKGHARTLGYVPRRKPVETATLWPIVPPNQMARSSVPSRPTDYRRKWKNGKKMEQPKNGTPANEAGPRPPPASPTNPAWANRMELGGDAVGKLLGVPWPAVRPPATTGVVDERVLHLRWGLPMRLLLQQPTPPPRETAWWRCRPHKFLLSGMRTRRRQPTENTGAPVARQWRRRTG